MNNPPLIKVLENDGERLRVVWGEVELVLSIHTGNLEGFIAAPTPCDMTLKQPKTRIGKLGTILVTAPPHPSGESERQP